MLASVVLENILVLECELGLVVEFWSIVLVVKGCIASTLGGDWGTGVVVVCVPHVVGRWAVAPHYINVEVVVVS